MKKFLVLLLGALMVLGFATAAFAIHEEAAVIEAGAAVAEPGTAFVFGGDARVRGIKFVDHDLNSDVDLGDQVFWDQRARFTIDAKTTGGVELRTRTTMGNNYVWGSDDDHQTCTEGTDTNGDTYMDCNGNNQKDLELDWAYLHFPVGPVTVDIGRQRANWGYKFFVWDSPADRLKVSGTFNNVRVSVGTDKVSEATGYNLDDKQKQVGGDYDKYFGAIGTTIGDWDLNALYISYKDARPLASDSDCDTAAGAECTRTGADEDGAVLDIFVTGKAGPVGLHLEYVTKSGDLFKTVDIDGDENDPSGGYFAVTGALGPVNAFAAYAMTRNGYVADNDFAPTLLVGTVQGTAMFDYGAGGRDFDGIVVGGTYPINEQASVHARYAAVTVSEYSAADDGKWNEINAQADYKVSKNLTTTLAWGQADLSGDAFDGADNPSSTLLMANYQF